MVVHWRQHVIRKTRKQWHAAALFPSLPSHYTRTTVTTGGSVAGNRWENDGVGVGGDVGNPRRGALNTEGGGGSGNRRYHTDEWNRTNGNVRISAAPLLHPRVSSRTSPVFVSSLRSFLRSLVQQCDDGSTMISPLLTLRLFFFFSLPVVQRNEEPRKSNVVPPPAKQCKSRRKRACGTPERERVTVSPLHTLTLDTIASEERERERQRKAEGEKALACCQTLPRHFRYLLLLPLRDTTFNLIYSSPLALTPSPFLFSRTLCTLTRGYSRAAYLQRERVDPIRLLSRQSDRSSEHTGAEQRVRHPRELFIGVSIPSSCLSLSSRCRALEFSSTGLCASTDGDCAPNRNKERRSWTERPWRSFRQSSAAASTTISLVLCIRTNLTFFFFFFRFVAKLIHRNAIHWRNIEKCY